MALAGENLQRFGDMSDVEVAKEDPDVRGWDVLTSDGRDLGEVKDLLVDPAAMKVRALEVELEGRQFDWNDNRRVAIPIDAVEIDDDRDHVVVRQIAFDEFRNYPAYAPETARGQRLAAGRAEAERAAHGREAQRSHEATDAPSGQRLTRAEEELAVGKREVQAGEMRLGKHVETEHVSQPVTRERERVRVERRPVSERAIGSADIGEQEIRVPVSEEQLVVEKRPVVKEELVVSKERVPERENVEADVRKEEFDVQGDGRVLDDTTRKGER